MILGLPRLHALRFDPTFASFSQVWPFDTGARLPARENGKARIVHAEIYPSMVRAVPTANQVKDEAQVIEQALQFARLDTTVRLAALFEVPSGLPTNDLAVIVAEEGWILGVTTPLGTCQR